MKKYILSEIAYLLAGLAGFAALIGFVGGIICTLDIFPTMAGTGTAIGALAAYFMEG